MEKKLSIANQLEQLSQVAVFTEELCEEMGWVADWVFNLNLVLEEAISNVIMYAFPGGGELPADTREEHIDHEKETPRDRRIA